MIPKTREGASTFEITSGPHLLYKESRVGLTLDKVIAEELEDFLASRLDAESEDDRAVWSTDGPAIRLVAVLRPLADGTLAVTRFDT